MATYLYRSDCIEGRIFETEEEVKQAQADGWVDAPGKCGSTPTPEKRGPGRPRKPRDEPT